MMHIDAVTISEVEQKSVVVHLSSGTLTDALCVGWTDFDKHPHSHMEADCVDKVTCPTCIGLLVMGTLRGSSTARVGRLKGK